jgi:hypothetical protein
MDLSKAFDCLPQDLLLLKIKFYSMSEQWLNYIQSYLSNRQQCVKMGNYTLYRQARYVTLVGKHTHDCCCIYYTLLRRMTENTHLDHINNW